MFHPVYNRDMAQNISVPDIGDFKLIIFITDPKNDIGY